MRLYYSHILRYTSYSPAYQNLPVEFHYKLRNDDRTISFYNAQTIEDLIRQIKADGHIIWGQRDILDYALPPKNAFEYLLIEALLKQRGMSDTDIAREFSFKEAE